MSCNLKVNVFSNWRDNAPIYRIYVNDDMLTERTFHWAPEQFYILENMHCNLSTGVHTLKLENLDPLSEFRLDNFSVDGVQVNTNLLKPADNNTIIWRFVVDYRLAKT